MCLVKIFVIKMVGDISFFNESKVLDPASLSHLAHGFARSKVIAAQSIANIVKTSLGPLGLDKMLVDNIGVRKSQNIYQITGFILILLMLGSHDLQRRGDDSFSTIR